MQFSATAASGTIPLNFFVFTIALHHE